MEDLKMAIITLPFQALFIYIVYQYIFVGG